jgi:hypothetical protein
MTQSHLCTCKQRVNTLKTKEKAMTEQVATAEQSKTFHPEYLEALLKTVPDCTVSTLKKLYEELSGEVTRSNNKPSLIRRVSARIQCLLEETNEISSAAETDISPDEDLDEAPVENRRVTPQ